MTIIMAGNPVEFLTHAAAVRITSQQMLSVANLLPAHAESSPRADRIKHKQPQSKACPRPTVYMLQNKLRHNLESAACLTCHVSVCMVY